MVCGETMTLHECAEALRANQISIAEDTLGHAIMQGKFSFAFGVDAEKERVYKIFRTAFYTWLDGMLMHESIRIDPI